MVPWVHTSLLAQNGISIGSSVVAKLTLCDQHRHVGSACSHAHTHAMLAWAPTSTVQWWPSTVPGEKLLIGRRPVRNWTQLQFFLSFTVVLLEKINKSCCHQSCTSRLQYAPNRLSAEALPQTPLGKLTALPRPPSCILGGYF